MKITKNIHIGSRNLVSCFYLFIICTVQNLSSLTKSLCFEFAFSRIWESVYEIPCLATAGKIRNIIREWGADEEGNSTRKCRNLLSGMTQNPSLE